MDDQRKFRFVNAPLFLYGSLGLAALVADQGFVEVIKGLPAHQLVALGAVLTASTVPVGLTLGALTQVGLRLFAQLVLGLPTHEMYLPVEDRTRIWKRISMGKRFEGERDAFLAGVTWDHEMVSKGVHDWVVRRWTAFNLSFNACTALLVALFIGRVLGISWSLEWVGTTAVLILVLATTGYSAWRDALEMLQFQSHRMQQRERKSPIQRLEEQFRGAIRYEAPEQNLHKAAERVRVAKLNSFEGRAEISIAAQVQRWQALPVEEIVRIYSIPE